MTSIDLKTLCHALGFTAVVMKDGVSQKNGAARATGLAGMIEEFCRTALPNSFSENSETSNPGGKFPLAQRMASTIVELYQAQGGCSPHDLLERGFSRDDVSRYWPLAKALAFVEMNIMDS
ncbi:MAG: hypothetical protein SFW62_07105 [Alphaproteobacteria bacterium]|nr:hypothetical protein [Alphaproteobacteria bacterium]